MANVFLIQLISADNGKRSDPFAADLEQLREVLRQTSDERDSDYVLMVGAKVEGEDFQITNTPLTTIAHLKATMVEGSLNG